MFGYVNADKKEMTDEERSTYQAYYCGLCRELKRQAGAGAQICLNYDITFLAILLSGLYEPDEVTEPFRCRLHPTKKRFFHESEVMQYAASMNIVLSYYKLLDDYQDDHKTSRKKIANRFEPVVKRVCEEYPRQTQAIEDFVRDLSDAEYRQEDNLTVLSALSGDMLGELFCYKEEDVWNESLRSMGYYLGKFIYLLDAYDDMEKDRKNHNFNPMLRAIDKDPSYDAFCRQVLVSLIAECTKEFERLPILKNASILRNILYSGIWTKYDMIQARRDHKCKACRRSSGQTKAQM
ncbi:MAG: DUF5685 family protein [Lachnospiraceae bacterium]|nr:DUF5685 family protein [Lachnospiraceae bacterium]MDD7702631.1 DUF5685 family protein [Lachnospiraceae bacterium]MDY3302478.1 DUF5685 family protein [Lachnospiraceae bacterium]